MYQLYSERSPNVYKITICLSELEQDWEDIWLDVTRGAQHEPAFRALNPNGRIPVLIDDAPTDGAEPMTIWESGSILLYLAGKHGAFMPTALRARTEAMTWLFWQMASLGPMAGQRAHFVQYDVPGSDYARERYRTETQRLYGVLDGQLATREWIAGDYSVVDMACFPWVRNHAFLGQDIAQLPALADWLERMAARPGVARAYERMDRLPSSSATIEERYQAMLPERGLEAQLR